MSDKHHDISSPEAKSGSLNSMQVCKLELQLEELQEQLDYQISQNTTLVEQKDILAEQNNTLKERENGLEIRLAEAETRNRALEDTLSDMNTRYGGLKQLLVKSQPTSSSPATAPPASNPAPFGVLPGQSPSSTAPFVPEKSTPRAFETPSVSEMAHTAPATPFKILESTKSPLSHNPTTVGPYPIRNQHPDFAAERAKVAEHARRRKSAVNPKTNPEGPPATTTPKSALE